MTDNAQQVPPGFVWGAATNLRVYFAWSLMDNFEWSFGDATQTRTIKESGRWYAKVIAANELVPAEDGA